MPGKDSSVSLSLSLDTVSGFEGEKKIRIIEWSGLERTFKSHLV